MRRTSFFKLLYIFCVFCVGLTVFSPANFFQAEAARGFGGSLQPTPPRPEFRPEPLPRTGTVAVLVRGISDQHNASVAALVSQRLTARGYRVVDERRMAAIRQSRIAEAALNGDVDAIIRLSRENNVGATITINAHARAERNPFGLWTGTASVAVMAMTSGGRMIYSDTVQGKAVTPTRHEAAQSAIEEAALQAVERMTG